VKIWHSGDWDETLICADTFCKFSDLSRLMAKYLAAGNMDRTVTVLSGTTSPWVMRGFPGKIRQLAWSEAKIG